jgi:outer membrane immunogenic protein
MKYIGTLCATAALAMLPKAALANDTWDGTYVGAFVGANASKTSYEDFGCWSACTQPTVQGASTVAGVAVGHDFQASEGIVIGAVADASTGQSRHFSPNGYENIVTSGTLAWRSKVSWQATARLRVGFTQGNSLIYLTGGAALAKARFAVEGREVHSWYPTHSTNFDSTWKGHRKGFVYGIGIEHKIGNIGLKAELLHVKFAPRTSCFSNSDGAAQGVCWNDSPVLPAISRTGHSTDGIRLGANFRF